MNANPLLQKWTEPDQMPPFSEIRNEHYDEAFHITLDEHKAEIQKIIETEEEPTFSNTIDALEKSGQALGNVCAIFFNLAHCHTNEELQKIDRDMSPRLAKHNNEIYLNQKLFGRVKTILNKKEDLNLTPEQEKVLEKYEKIFIHAGAQLDDNARKRMNEISQRIAEITTLFSQNVLKNETDYHLFLESDEDLEGLPDFLVKSATQTAKDLGMADKKVITLSRSSIEPFLQFSARRDLREKAFKAWINRGAHDDETNNRPLIVELISLRDEMAKLLGFENYAKFKLSDKMAKQPENAKELLTKVWHKALKRVEKERQELQDEMTKDGINAKLEPWDWRYYSEHVRKAKYDLNEADLKPYSQLDNLINASFKTANQLFGLSFEELKDYTTYHPDVRVWDVKDKDGKFIARFIGDYFARPSKMSGAWMSSFRDQEKLNGTITPIIINVLNLVKGEEGKQALLTYDDARTVFHEFGHALHGMLSNVTYPILSGTSVAHDFVELPSQLYEHWLSQPIILNEFAKHVETQAPIPQDMLNKLKQAQNFNQGFMTVEYLAAALVDMEIHELENITDLDVEGFEKQTLEKLGMPSEIVMRHRLPHFLHLFAGGYSAGYYSYMWSEVMDADAFKAFEETGNVFNKELAEKLKTHIYSSGGTLDPEIAYKNFRGQAPSVEPLLEKRGLV